MTELAEPRPAEDDAEVGLPLFWGLILVTVVALIAVWLFGRIEADSAEPEGTLTTLVEEPETTTTVAGAEAGTIVDVLAADARFITLLGLADRAGLTSDLEGAGPFTVFAPTDDAFSGIELVDDPAVIRELVSRHLVAGRLTDADILSSAPRLETFGSEWVSVVAEPEARIGGAALIGADLEASNGLIHVVAGPLLAVGDEGVQALNDDGRFGTLLAAVEAAGLGEAISGDVTVLAPTDEAFAALPSGVVAELLADPERLGSLLGYHLVPGVVSGAGSYPTANGDVVVVTATEVDGVAIAGTPAPNVVALEGVLVPPGFVLADVNDILDLAPITFEVGSAVITPDGGAELDRAVEYLIANPVPIEIGGHTDADGSDEANLTLSEQRARAVADYLVAGGVDASLLTAIGYGETQPVAGNDTAEGRAQNRRIEFAILG